MIDTTYRLRMRAMTLKAGLKLASFLKDSVVLQSTDLIEYPFFVLQRFDVYDFCDLKGQPAPFRPEGMKWDINEFPLMRSRPKAYVYDCERCGLEFSTDYEVHVPYCQKCRAETIDQITEKEGRVEEE